MINFVYILDEKGTAVLFKTLSLSIIIEKGDFDFPPKFVTPIPDYSVPEGTTQTLTLPEIFDEEND